MTNPENNKSRKDMLDEQAISVAGETDPAPGIDAAQCAACGMPKKEWINEGGVKNGDREYCCEGCAEGRGCECF